MTDMTDRDSDGRDGSYHTLIRRASRRDIRVDGATIHLRRPRKDVSQEMLGRIEVLIAMMSDETTAPKDRWAATIDVCAFAFHACIVDENGVPISVNDAEALATGLGALQSDLYAECSAIMGLGRPTRESLAAVDESVAPAPTLPEPTPSLDQPPAPRITLQ